MVDLRPRFRAPTIDEYRTGVSGLGAATQSFGQGMGALGQAAGQVATTYMDQKRKKEFAGQLKTAMENNPRLKGMSAFVNEHNAEQIAPQVAGYFAKDDEMVDTPYGRMSPDKWAAFQEHAQRDREHQENQKALLDARASEAETRRIMAESAAQQREADRAMREWMGKQNLQMRGESIKAQHPFMSMFGFGPDVPDPYDQSSFPAGGGPVAPQAVLPPRPPTQEQIQQFDSEAAAEKANLKPGTKIMIKRRPAVVQ